MCVVSVTNGVPTVQNVKITYKTLAFMANGGTKDQDQDAYDAHRQTQIFLCKLKKTVPNNEEICRVAKANNIMIDGNKKKKSTWS